VARLGSARHAGGSAYGRVSRGVGTIHRFASSPRTGAPVSSSEVESQNSPAGFSAIPVAATAMVPDPIFAAIERHKALNAAFSHTLRLKDAFERGSGFDDDSPEHEDLERREDETCDAEREACDEMVATVPTTLAGLLALLRYVDWHERLSRFADQFNVSLSWIVVQAGHLPRSTPKEDEL
jgi:hypothetical protein